MRVKHPEAGHGVRRVGRRAADSQGQHSGHARKNDRSEQADMFQGHGTFLSEKKDGLGVTEPDGNRAIISRSRAESFANLGPGDLVRPRWRRLASFPAGKRTERERKSIVP